MKKSEREGFEPSVPLRVLVLSRDVPLAAQPSFQYENSMVLLDFLARGKHIY